MKFCPQCGRENNTDCCFCQYCCRPIPAVKSSCGTVNVPSPAVEPESSPKKGKGPLIGVIVAITVVLIAVAALVLWLFLPQFEAPSEDRQDTVSSQEKPFRLSSPKDVASIYFEATNYDPDTETLLYLMSEDVVGCYLADEEWDKMIEEGNQMLELRISEILERTGWSRDVFLSIKFEVGDVSYYDQYDLDEVQAKYGEKYGIEIDDAATVELKTKLEIDGVENTDTLDVKVVKINGYWYLHYNAIDFDLHCFDRGYVRYGE